MRPIKSLIILKIAAIICLLFPLGLNAQNWPMVNACMERTSWAEGETELIPPLQKSNEFSLDGTASGISFYENTLFVSIGGEPNRLVAFNPQNSIELWHFEIPNSFGSVNVTPAINDSLVLFGGQGGLGLYALDRFTGEEKWFKSVGSLYSNNPIIDSNRVYIVADSLYCLDINNGATIWSFAISSGITPAVDNEYVYICRYNRLIALHKLKGEIAWQIENTEQYHNAVTVDENFVYTCISDSIVALQKESGSVSWSYIIPDGQFPDLSAGAIAISDSFLCASIWENADENGQLYTLDKITGEYRWHHTFDTTGVFSPSIANGIVYAINWKTESVWGFDLNTGQAVFFDDSERYLKECIIANGKLFVGTFGKVVTFENFGTGSQPFQTPNQNSSKLLKSWPNPFKQSTRFEFYLNQSDHINVSVYDLTGKRVRTISDRFYEVGSYSLNWDGKDERNKKVPSGVYILRLSSKQTTRSGRMILVE